MRVSGTWVLALAACIGTAPRLEAAFPHEQQLAPGVWAVGFADRYQSANCGWAQTKDATLLIDLPRGIAPGKFVDAVTQITGKPVTAIALTHAVPDDAPLVDELRARGVKRVYLSPATYKTLTSAGASDALPEGFVVVAKRSAVGDSASAIEFLPLDECRTTGAAAVYLAGPKILFAGPLVFHGPRAPLAETDTEAWIAALTRLAELRAVQLVPGFGTWGSADLLDRQRRFLLEMRRQVGYFIAQGRPHEDLQAEIRLSADVLVWMPYDTPLAEDIEWVYQELTVPQAPFRGRPPKIDDAPPHALVLIGDLPHEPGHVEQGLRPVFEATGVVPHFVVDVRALSAENLAHVRLLVILRDGLQRPKSGGQADYMWMTPEQERAVVEFVQRGGSFLNLHNSMGLYPDNGPYLNLVGGRYIGHGPLERFRVEVVDRDHPVTRGVVDFSVADEQHTPPCDERKVHVLLRNRSDEGQTAAAGWVYEPGQGRLCHLANGHTRESLLHPMVQRLMCNAVNWCLRRDAADGAK
jgi:type 1 glutamine amidotransferase/glyoxylase-like metal-dependent hydrolase (beta-lactamase superfamily II)